MSEAIPVQIELLIQEALSGDMNAQCDLGDTYRDGYHGDSGEEITKDERQAVEWYRKSADQGLARGEDALAGMYYFGYGVKKSRKQSALWYKKAAEQGYDSAQASLANMYRDGEGVAEDSEQAFYWFRKAADQGARLYQRILADALLDEDPQEAAHWYQLAAEAGDEEAQLKLGQLYENGNGVPKNDEEAFHWYLGAEKLEAEDDEFSGARSDARYEVGRCYATGQGVEKNSAEALKRLLPIADPKVTEDPWRMSRAQIWVVTIFADPEHAKHDLVEAYAWLNLAAAYAPTGQEFCGIMSRKSAAEFRETLGARLTKEQMKQAQLRSKELFVPRKKIDVRLGTG